MLNRTRNDYRASVNAQRQQVLFERLEPRQLFSAITEFGGMTPNATPIGIAATADGSIWFTEDMANKIGRLASNGQLTEYPLPSTANGPSRMATGPDGNAWFVSSSGDINRIDSNGNVETFQLPDRVTVLATDHAGRLVVAGHNWVGWLDTSGSIVHEVSINPISWLGGIAIAPDNTVWIADAWNDKFVHINGDDSLSSVTPVGFNPSDEYIEHFTFGPDGNIWLLTMGSSVCRMSPDGSSFTRFVLRGAMGSDIISGPDGNLWATFNGGSGRGVARITTSGVITPFYNPVGEALPQDITVGSDGNLWFPLLLVNEIAKLDLSNLNDTLKFQGTDNGSTVMDRPMTVTAASFTPVNSSDAISDYTATIDWGDGQTSSGQIVRQNNLFNVVGTHTYTRQGTAAYVEAHGRVAITGHGVTDVIGYSTVVTAPPPFTIPAGSITVLQGQPFTSTLNRLTPNYAGIDLSKYSAAVELSGGVLIWCDLGWNNRGQVVLTPQEPLTFNQYTSLSMFITGPDITDPYFQVTVHVTPAPPNLDSGTAAQLGLIVSNYGITTGATKSMGDVNGDGRVDVADLGMLATNYVQGGGVTPASRAVMPMTGASAAVDEFTLLADALRRNQLEGVGLE